MTDCGCSIRKPIEKGLGSMYTPCSSNIEKVSRALCPIAITMWRLFNTVPSAKQTPVTCRSAFSFAPSEVDVSRRFGTKSTKGSWRKCTTLESNIISPPRRIISARIRSTIVTSLNVPMWGLLKKRISGGAPAFTNSSSTLRPRCRLSFTWL